MRSSIARQEAAGIVTFDDKGKQFHTEKRMGLVGDHYTDPVTLARLPGEMAIGHTRYSTRARWRCAMCSRFSPSLKSAALPSRTMAISPMG